MLDTIYTIAILVALFFGGYKVGKFSKENELLDILNNELEKAKLLTMFDEYSKGYFHGRIDASKEILEEIMGGKTK